MEQNTMIKVLKIIFVILNEYVKKADLPEIRNLIEKIACNL